MKRAKPYKIFFVLAVIVLGGICIMLPEKKMVPAASMSGMVKKISANNIDTLMERHTTLDLSKKHNN